MVIVALIQYSLTRTDNRLACQGLLVRPMTALVTPVEVLPAEPGHDYRATYCLDGQYDHLQINAASHYEVWLIVKRSYPMACVVAILLVTI